MLNAKTLKTIIKQRNNKGGTLTLTVTPGKVMTDWFLMVTNTIGLTILTRFQKSKETTSTASKISGRT